MKNYNTRFAVQYERDNKTDFVRKGRQVCIYTMREAMKIRNKLKAQGCRVALMPYCE